MPSKPSMTWIESRKGWIKNYKGKIIAVSCRQLGIDPPSKTASMVAANKWWTAKEKELSGSVTLTEHELLHRSIKQHELVHEYTNQRAELATKAAKETFDRVFFGSPTTSVSTDATTVGAAVEQFIGRKVLRSRTGAVSASTVSGYPEKLKRFVRFVGEDFPVKDINGDVFARFIGSLLQEIAAGKKAHATHVGTRMAVIQFIKHLWSAGKIDLPRNLDDPDLRIPNPAKEIETVPVERIRKALTLATDRTKLFILLALNCGMLQGDMTALRVEEIDFDKGTITRRRSKTHKHASTPKVTYKLWKETAGYLKFLSNDSGLALTGDEGQPLTRNDVSDDGKRVRYDKIQKSLNTLFENFPGETFSIKQLRTTAATTLAEHPQYKFYAQYFLAHSPNKPTDKNYVRPNDKEFFQACDWLREKILGA